MVSAQLAGTCSLAADPTPPVTSDQCAAAALDWVGDAGKAALAYNYTAPTCNYGSKPADYIAIWARESALCHVGTSLALFGSAQQCMAFGCAAFLELRPFNQGHSLHSACCQDPSHTCLLTNHPAQPLFAYQLSCACQPPLVSVHC